MSDTNIQECNCCQITTDCIDGLCELCSGYNYKLQKQANLLTLGLLQEKQKVATLLHTRDELLAALQPFANFFCDDWQTHKCFNCIAKQAIANAEGAK